MGYVTKMNEALEYIEENLESGVDYGVMCKIACMSKSSFQKTFLFFTGITVSEYIRRLRLARAAGELAGSNIKVIDIAVKYGYDSASSFSRAFREVFGETPTEVRRRQLKISFPSIRFQTAIGRGEMKMNEKVIIRAEEHLNEKAVCFDADCYDAETEAWGQMAEWCRQNIPDRTARRFVGVAPEGHHPGGEQHKDAQEHVRHPYRAMMLLIGDEGGKETFHGRKVVDAPQGLFLVNDVALNQYDQDGNLDIALSMIKASEAFVEFVDNTEGYEFDMEKGIFYEEHIFSEEWFRNGGVPDGLKMWVPVLKR